MYNRGQGVGDDIMGIVGSRGWGRRDKGVWMHVVKTWGVAGQGVVEESDGKLKG